MAQAPSRTFYRRPLPEQLIAFESGEGRQIFREALQAGYMEGYFSLASQFHTQNEPAYCGPGTLTMVLNALSVDPRRVWKGPWRWFSEELLSCCKPLDEIKAKGMTFAEFACLARCNGAKIEKRYATNSTEEEFRSAVKSAISKSEGEVVVVSYNRGSLGQTGSGHFSPIGGYHPERDLVLIMDVARFKYPPHWAPLSLVFESQKPIDPDSGKSRGYMVLRPSDYVATFCRITAGTNDWGRVVTELWIRLPEAVKDNKVESLEGFIALVLHSLDGGKETSDPLIRTFTKYQSELHGPLSAEHKDYVDNMKKEITQTSMYMITSRLIDSLPLVHKELFDKELIAVILLSLPVQICSKVSESIKMDYIRMISEVKEGSLLSKETHSIRDSLSSISDFCGCCTT